MKIKSLVQLTTAATLLPFATSAATVTWDGLGDGSSYIDDNNWGGAAPADDLTTDVAQFTGGTVDLTTTRQVSGLDFSSGTTLSGTGSIEVGSSGITLSGDSNISTAGLILNSATSITLNGTLGISSVLTGTGDLTVTAGSATEFSMTGVNGDDSSSGYSGNITFDGITATVGRYFVGNTGGANTLSLLNGATLNATGNLQMGGRDIIISGGATINQFGSSNIYGFTGQITGDGGLTFGHLGGGNRDKIQLDGTMNTFTGGVTIDGVDVHTKGAGGLGDAANTITFDNGGFLNMLNNGDHIANRDIVLDGAGKVRITTTWTYTGNISGAGSLEIVSTGQEHRWGDVPGDANTYTGGTILDNAGVRVDTGAVFGTGDITLRNGAYLKNDNSNASFSQNIIVESTGGGIESGWGNRSITMSGLISGDGLLTIRNDSSRVQFQNTGNTYSGGTEILGTLWTKSGSLGTGDVTLNAVTAGRGHLQNNNGAAIHSNNLIIAPNGGRMQAGWSSDLEITGVVSGTGNLQVVGDSGTVVLSNTGNTFSGDIALTDSDSRLKVGSLESGAYDGVISGAGTFEYSGSGTQVLTGTNTYTGETTISGGGTLDLGGSTANGSLASTVLNMEGGGLDYTRTGGTTHSFTTTNINAGSSTISTVAGNTLNLGALNYTAGSVDIGSTGTITTSTANDASGILGGWATFGGDTWAVGNGALSAITGFSAYTQTSSAGTSAANYAGNNIDVDSSEGVIDAVITPNTLRFNDAAANTLTLAAGTNVINSNGILVTSNVGNNLSTITGGNLTGAVDSDLAIFQNNTSNALSVDSVIENNNSTSLTKGGAGTVILTADNTYTGATNISEGTLKVTNNSDTTAVNIATGATFELDFNNRWGAITTISGGGNLVKSGTSAINFERATFALESSSLIDIQAGTFTGGSTANENWSNNMSDLNIASGATFRTAEANVRVDAITGDGTLSSGFNGAGYTQLTIGVANGDGTFSGVIEDTNVGLNHIGNIEKIGTGTQTLAGANTFSGYTLVSGGTLNLANDLALQNSALDTAGAGQITLTGVTTPTIGGLNGSNDLASVITTGYDSVTALTLNTGAGSSHNFSGAIADSSAGLSLIKTGEGTQTLSGNNTYTGSTTVSSGLLQFQGDVASDSFSIASGATLEIDTTAGGQQFNGGTISGDGTFIKSGTGDLLLGANGSTQNISMSGGLIDVQEGTLRNEYGRGDWSANQSSLNVASGATVDTWDSAGGIRVDALTGEGTVTHTSYGSANNLTVGVNGGGGTFSGLITDDGTRVLGLVKEGAGTQVLTGNNNYQGTTTINGGTLQIGDGGTTGSLGAGDVTNDGVLVVDRSNTFTLGNNISGTGSVELSSQSGGDSGISGTNSYTGGTTINAGRFRLANDGNLGDTSSTLTLNGGGIKNNGGALTLDAARNVVIDDTNGGRMQAGWSSDLTVAGVISGAGLLTIEGDSGRVVLSNTGNSFTGDIFLQDSNSTLVANSLGAGAYAGVISGDGTFTWAGEGAFTGTNTVTGATVVQSGGSIGGSGSFAGDLTLEAGSKFIFSETDTLTIAGAVNLFAGFGVDDIDGLGSGTAVGTYTLIDGTTTVFSEANIDNFGLANAFNLGGGLIAYFENGSLDLVVAVPEPSTFALFAGLLAIGSVLSRRRRG